jgi:hypothetical protein
MPPFHHHEKLLHRLLNYCRNPGSSASYMSEKAAADEKPGTDPKGARFKGAYPHS